MKIISKISYYEHSNRYIVFTTDNFKCCGNYGFTKPIMKKYKFKCIKSK